MLMVATCKASAGKKMIQTLTTRFLFLTYQEVGSLDGGEQRVPIRDRHSLTRNILLKIQHDAVVAQRDNMLQVARRARGLHAR